MTRAIRLWPLLTGTQRYEKIVSTRDRGHGQYIQAPILAYLIETPNGRVLYDVGCDYNKVYKSLRASPEWAYVDREVDIRLADEESHT